MHLTFRTKIFIDMYFLNKKLTSLCLSKIVTANLSHICSENINFVFFCCFQIILFRFTSNFQACLHENKARVQEKYKKNKLKMTMRFDLCPFIPDYSVIFFLHISYNLSSYFVVLLSCRFTLFLITLISRFL